MSDVQLGLAPGPDSERDAIHVAVVPMVAAYPLRPGQQVRLIDGGAGPATDIVGVVDPYLTDVVPKGGMFWLCLLPNTVTDMRHHWTHPAFDHAENIVGLPSKEESEAWLRGFADTADCPDYDTLLKAASGGVIECIDPAHYKTYTIDDDYLFFSGRDAHGEIPSEFWDHVENITGKPCPSKPRLFSCSC